jgi:predicted RND superfamily exporter protein
MDVRDRIEVVFERWGRFVYRRAWVTIAVVVLGVFALCSQLPGLVIEPSMEAFLHEDDPTRTTYDAFRAQFGRDDVVLIALRTSEVFDLPFLERLRALHRELESEVPRVQEVTSLINARSTRGSADELIVEDLFEEWPGTPAELAVLRDRALSNPLYRNLLLSEDGRLTAIVVELDTYSSTDGDAEALEGFVEPAAEEGMAQPARPFLTGEENAAVVGALHEVVARYRTPETPIYVAGTPAMNEHLQQAMRADMGRFTLLAVLSIAIFLAVLFRRAVGVLPPLVVVVLAVVSTLSAMAIAGVPITPPTQVLPSFLLAVGVGGCVHVLAIYFQRRTQGDESEDAIAFALGHSGLAVTMTSLTTVGGLSSFAAAELAPIGDFGTFGPVGVIFALVFTLSLLPALIAVFPQRRLPAAHSTELARSQRALAALGDASVRHPHRVVGLTAALLVVALLGASQIRFSFRPNEWFPEGDPFRISNDLLNDEMKGTMFLEVLVDTQAENGLHDPDLLNGIEEMRRYAESVEMGDLVIGKTISIVDVVKEIHRALNENRPEFYGIPQDPLLVAQELLLFENAGSDDLADVADSRFRTARFTMKLPFVDAIQYRPFIENVETEFGRILGPGPTIVTTGIMALLGRTISAVIETMVRSYIIAFLVITPLMVFMIGKLRIGLVSMIPNLTPIVLTLGLMGWVGIPLNPFTLLIGSIALGLAVDDTIHFMHGFRRYYARSADVRLAVRETLLSTGQALLFTSLVLSTGFFIFTFASLTNLFHFGLLTGFTIVMAFLADVVLAPALMALMFRSGAPGPGRSD